MSLNENHVRSIEATLAAIGSRVAKVRLARNQTQADLARDSGASLSSIKRLEAGENTSLDTLIRVLGALKLDQRLLDFLPDLSVRPMERVRHKGVERKRARAKKVAGQAPWVWRDEA